MQFSSGQQSLKDDKRIGRPKSAVTKSNADKIKSIIVKDARYTVRQITQMTNLGLATLHHIIKEIHKVRKHSAR